MGIELKQEYWFLQQPKEFYAAVFQGLVRNKNIFQTSTLVYLSYISICNLLIDLPWYKVGLVSMKLIIVVT
jgi:hypothetical protein